MSEVLYSSGESLVTITAQLAVSFQCVNVVFTVANSGGTVRTALSTRQHPRNPHHDPNKQLSY